MRYRGRPLIERRLAETFAESPGVKLEIKAEAIQFLSPDVAKEEGDHGERPSGAPAGPPAHGAAREAGRAVADLEHPRGGRPTVSPRDGSRSWNG